jgi:hypothetical protein
MYSVHSRCALQTEMPTVQVFYWRTVHTARIIRARKDPWNCGAPNIVCGFRCSAYFLSCNKHPAVLFVLPYYYDYATLHHARHSPSLSLRPRKANPTNHNTTHMSCLRPFATPVVPLLLTLRIRAARPHIEKCLSLEVVEIVLYLHLAPHGRLLDVVALDPATRSAHRSTLRYAPGRRGTAVLDVLS